MLIAQTVGLWDQVTKTANTFAQWLLTALYSGKSRVFKSTFRQLENTNIAEIVELQK